ncbi:MAG: hypothetical protein ACRCUB_00920, partial [Plesiomonas shigelloides]
GRLLTLMLLSDDLKMAKDEIEHEIELVQNILDSDLCKPRKRVAVVVGPLLNHQNAKVAE